MTDFRPRGGSAWVQALGEIPMKAGRQVRGSEIHAEDL